MYLQELIDRYRQLYAGVIYDAMSSTPGYSSPFVVDRAIGKVAGPRCPLVGPTFTVRGRQYSRADGEDLGNRAARMFGEVPPGAVLVLDTGGDQVVAHFGDVSALLALQAEAAGCVIDGYTRDVERIEGMAFPLFARGATPQDALSDWGIVEWGCPLSLPGTAGAVQVQPGDIMFADRDGVMVIPHGMAWGVLEAAEARARNEQEIIRAIKAGESALAVHERLGKW